MAKEQKSKETALPASVSTRVAHPAEAQVAEIHAGCKAILEGLGIAVSGNPVTDFNAAVRAIR